MLKRGTTVAPPEVLRATLEIEDSPTLLASHRQKPEPAGTSRSQKEAARANRTQQEGEASGGCSALSPTGCQRGDHAGEDGSTIFGSKDGFHGPVRMRHEACHIEAVIGDTSDVEQ
jgi:hypothetical protein